MQKSNLLSVACILLLAMVACSKNEYRQGEQNPVNSIRFEASTGRQTKAVETTSVNLVNYPFGVFAYSTQGTPWEDFEVVAPDVMDDETVTYNSGSRSWAYEGLKFWPNNTGDMLSFFSYWPKTNANDLAFTSQPVVVNLVDGRPILDVKANINSITGGVSEMIDVVAAANTDLSRCTGPVVTIHFRHILTRVKFSAIISGDGYYHNGDLISTVEIQGIRLLGTNEDAASGAEANPDSRVFKKAQYDLATPDGAGLWMYDVDNKGLVIGPEPSTMPGSDNLAHLMAFEDGATSIVVTPGETMTNLFKDEQYLFLIPPRGKNGIESSSDVRVAVSYKITPVNATDTPEFVTSVIPLPNGALKEGKAYNIVFNAGLSAIRLDAVVDEWGDETTTNIYLD